MDADEIGHLVVHYFALAELEGQVLVVFIFLGGLRVLPDIVKNEIRVVVHHVRAHGDEAQLLASVHDVPGALLLLVHRHRQLDLICIRVQSVTSHVLGVDAQFFYLKGVGHGGLRFYLTFGRDLLLVVEVDVALSLQFILGLRVCHGLRKVSTVNFGGDGGHWTGLSVVAFLVEFLHIVCVGRRWKEHDLFV